MHGFGSPPSSEAQQAVECPSSALSRHADTAVADGRVSVRRPHGSPDGGQFRRFRVAEDNSACNTRRRLEISEISGPSPIPSRPASHPAAQLCHCAEQALTACLECGDRPELARQSPARSGTIVEMHQTVPAWTRNACGSMVNMGISPVRCQECHLPSLPFSTLQGPVRQDGSVLTTAFQVVQDSPCTQLCCTKSPLPSCAIFFPGQPEKPEQEPLVFPATRSDPSRGPLSHAVPSQTEKPGSSYAPASKLVTY